MPDLLEEFGKFQGENLRNYSKNWKKHAKDPNIWDLISNGLKLDFKEIPL